MSKPIVLLGPQFPYLQPSQEFLSCVSEGLATKYQFLAHLASHAHFMDNVQALHRFYLVLEGTSDSQFVRNHMPGQPLRAAGSWPVWDSGILIILLFRNFRKQVLQKWLLRVTGMRGSVT